MSLSNHSQVGQSSSIKQLRRRQCRILRAAPSLAEPLEGRVLLANTIYVDVNSPGPTRDGTSWGSAYADLQLGLGAAVSGDEIHVADGTYKPTTSTSREISFQLKTGVGIYGGYAGYGAVTPDARNVTSYPTILSGDIGTVGTNTDNSYQVVVGSGTNNTAILDGFIITAGNGRDGSPSGAGGGMYNESGSPTLTNCTFSGNLASSGGGMCNNTSSSPTLINCAFSGNTANYGGGMTNGGSSSPVLTNCTFSSNTAYTVGGGVYNSSGSPTLTNCTFSGNTAYTRGGGMDNSGSSFTTTTNCAFIENSVTASDGSGGAISNSGSGTQLLTNCTFVRNSNTQGKGGAVCSFTSSAFFNCTFLGNSAYKGGAIFVNGSSPTLVGCVVSGNVASDAGGGMYNYYSSPTLTNCTFSGNSGSYGGGLYSMPYYTNPSAPTLTNCIIWANTAIAGSQIRQIGDGLTITYSDIQGGWTGSGNMNIDPLFSRNPSPGTDVKWGTADDDYGDLGLRAYSPVADAGNNDFVPAGIITDAAGNGRFQDIFATPDTGLGASPIVDMGAYEALPALACDTGGPYAVIAGQSISFRGRGASDLPGDLQYAWEWTGDGKFDESTIQNPVFTSQGWSGTSVPVLLRVTDAGGHSIVSATTLRIVPAIIYVDPAATGANDGTTWTNAFKDLVQVIAQATPGQQIRVAHGIYKPTTGTDRSAAFRLRNGVTLTGGYAGYGAANPDLRNPTRYRSILSGDIGVAGNISDNSYHVVVASETDTTAALDGFTITAGNVSGSGGGIYIFGSATRILNCTIVGNTATSSGAGIYAENSTATFVNCVMTGNTGSSTYTYGAGVTIESSSGTLINCLVSSNSYGALYAYGSTLTLTNSIVWGNWTDSGNVVIVLSGSTAAITYSDIQGGYSGTGNINLDPLFLHPASSGSDGKWGTADDYFGDPRTARSSPVIDAGNNAAVPPDVSADIAGAARFSDDPNRADTGLGTAPIVDIGPSEAVWRSVVYVDARAAAGNNDGSDWTNAYTSIAEALTYAGAGQAIRVAGGTNKPTTGSDRTATFQLKNGVSITGGYAGLGTGNPDARDVLLYPTILSGEIGAAGAADNCYHVVTGSGTNATAVLDGVRIVAGNANGIGTGQSFGGGMYVASGSPTINNCTFSSNTATSGGGMYTTSAAAALTACTFSGNFATNGGAIYSATSSSLTITNCTFSRNSAGSGGGLYNGTSTVAITNCVFDTNTATTSGGALYSSGGLPTLTNCTLVGNLAATTGPGGGIFSSSTETRVVNCILWGNGPVAATQIVQSGGTAIVTYSDVQGGFAGTGNINADPQFVRSPWAGPDGVFGTTDDESGDWRLRAGSPALDIASNTAIPAGVTTDLAGNARIQNSTVDMGAYEGPNLAPAPKTVYVDLGATGANIGTSWTDAFTSLQSALLAVVDGDTIRIADGTYKPTSTTDRSISFALRNAVAIYGGYTGFGATNPDARDVALYPTTLSGDIGVSGSNADNSYHVVTGSGIDATAVLDGVAITAGSANGTGAGQNSGGAVYVATGNPSLANCTFANNTATLSGGGVFVGGAATLTNCTFTGNSVTSSSGTGGGIYNNAGTPTLINCAFNGNSAPGASGAGGGMYNSSGNASLTNCAFAGNSAGNGGGIYNSAAAPKLTNCTFAGNSTAGSGQGGGIYNTASSPTLTNCTFTRNTAFNGAGMANVSSSAPTLTNSTFNGNLATTSFGGGIYNTSSSPTVTGCAFIGNLASSGGGIYNTSSSPKLTNCTFVGNSASSSGGALAHGTSSSPVIANCVVWGNSPAANQIPTGISSVTYSDVQGAYTGAGNINADPLFVRSPGAGLDGKWGTTDDDYGDLRMSPFSPCNDAGNNAVVPVGMTTDQAGNPRFRDLPSMIDTGAGTAPIVDMGALETVPSVAARTDGPYIVTQGQNITLHGQGAASVAGVVQFAWEWTGDGKFNDATGANPVFNATGWPAGYTTVYLRVTDAGSQSAIATTTLRVLPAVLYVDASATGTNDGLTWANACTSLATALSVAVAGVPGQQIRVAQGTYKPTTGVDRTATFQLKNNVSVLGGYAGQGAANPDARDVALYSTILSGEIGTASVADNSYHVVTGGGTDATAVLNGVTIRAGNANGAGTGQNSGGGMYVSAGSPTISNCTFSGNSAANGGAICNVSSSSPTFTNCTISGNLASSSGGGMYDSNSSPILVNCVFVGNLAVTGGGIYESSATIKLTNCTLSGNSALNLGGGLYQTASSPTLANCIVWGNTALGGAQIYRANGTPTISFSDIQGGFSGTGNVNIDPLFVRTPSSGGDGKWGTADDDFGDLRLQATSPIADAGRNADVPASVLVDLAGKGRFQDIPTTSDSGTGTAPIVDMGAYEAAPALAASAGGQYFAVAGQNLTLNGFGSSDLPGTLQLAWEWSGDGLYDDATGPHPLFPTAGLPIGVPMTISLRVTDSSSQTVTCIAIVTVEPAVAYVDARATGANNGASWSDAFPTLAMALNQSVPGQVIHVATGTYTPTMTSDRTIAFQLPGNVSVLGGYAGLGAPSPDARDISLYPTVLSGDIGTVGTASDNSYHVVVSGDSSQSTLNGFTITGGNANGSAPYDSGGGMCAVSSLLSLSNCTFSINSAASQGGGVYFFTGAATLTNCAFTGNSAANGGGIHNASSSLSLTNCTFSANTVSTSGGGMYNSSSSPTISSCAFTGNTATTSGGGIYNTASSPVLTGCSFLLNTTSVAGGGAMYNTSSSSARLSNCVFNGNTATGGSAAGGAIYNTFSSPSFTNCVFSGNSATGSGGAIYNTSSSAPTFTNCTLSGNSAGGAGGAVFNSSSTPKLVNCIAWGNSAASENQISSTSSVTYSDVQGGFTGTGNRNSNPQFIRVPSAGTDGKWGTADDDYGDLRSRPWSPTVDAGSNAGAVGVKTDIVGNPRFLDVPTTPDTGLGTAPLVDMGAYEIIPALAASAGGPYSVIKGETTTLSGIGSSSVAGPLQYAWEWTGDGLFDDGIGQQPVFDTHNFPVSTLTVSLRVTDAQSNSVISTGSITITPCAYVDSRATGANDGTSWANAYTSLATALTNGVATVPIRVAGGTYRPTAGTDRTIAFQLKSGVRVLGGYAGLGDADPDARDVLLHSTILSGDIGAVGIATDNSYHVVSSDGVAITAILDGFQITGGNANGIAPYNSGGGMYVGTGSATFSNCTFSANSASASGGAIYIAGGNQTFTSCTFKGNTVTGASGIGGGVYISSAPASFTNCVFSGNSATGNSGSGGGVYTSSSPASFTDCLFSGNSAQGTLVGGGGMYNSSGNPTITNCTFSGNTVRGFGGAMYNSSASPSVVNSTFIANGTTGSGFGGGIFNMNSAPSVTNCTFTRNSSIRGGGMGNSSSTPTLTNCTFNGNMATNGSGGGISNEYGSPTIAGCAFSGNLAGRGGAVYNLAASPRLTNCTFAGNVGIYSGGALANEDTSSSPVITNCIVWGNTPAAEQIATGTANVTYSDVQGSYSGMGNINADPLFARSPNAGPDGKGGTTDDDYGDLRMSPFSPCNDAGNKAAVPTGLSKDLAGNPRFLDIPTTPDTGSGSAPVVDMGAYETVPAAAARTDGPYSVTQGWSLTLHGFGAGSVAGTLQFAWEWTGDGKFDDGTGPNPIFNSTGWPAGNTTVSLRITDAGSQSAIATTMLRVLPAVLYVDANATGANDGSTWANAFTSLATALNAAVAGVPGQQIHVADGTYKPTPTSNRAISLQLKNGVSVLGGYAGFGGADADARDVALYSTILSGDIGGTGASDNSYHVVTGNGTDATAVLDGFTITAGTANGVGSEQTAGGAIYATEGSPTINNCTFSTNWASSSGGAIYLANGEPAFTDCTFSGNIVGGASGMGGAVHATSGSPRFTNCIFTGNATLGSSGIGGAMYNYNAAPTLTNCTFTSNTSTSSGGAIYNSFASFGITGCTFTGNSASIAGTGVGGAIYNATSSQVITNCSFTRNSAVNGGAIANRESSSQELVSCVFTGNIASNVGGGLWDSESSTSLTNCIFVGNSAIRGGGLHCSSPAAPALTNCTFTANSASEVGGGLSSDSSTSPLLVNCIFWANLAPSFSQIHKSTSTFNASYCDIQGGSAGDGNINADPLFNRNPSAGGDGKWGTDDDDYGDLVARITSPVIDAGKNQPLISAGIVKDLAGNNRFIDIPTIADTGVGTAPIADIGAYETEISLAANAGGPYAVALGQSIVLDGLGISNVPGPLEYAWDWSGNGLYTDGTGPHPTFECIGRTVPSTMTVSLRITDSTSNFTIATTSISIGPTVYVDVRAPGANDGTSWSNAFHNLASTMSQAIPGTMICVAAGTYKPTAASDRTVSFQLKNGVILVGGYAGYGTPNPDTRDISLYPTILSGDIGSPSVNSDNSCHVVVCGGTGYPTIMEGFRITGGNADTGDPQDQYRFGGGFYCTLGSPTIRDCTFIANSAVYGGGMAVDSASPTVINCDFAGNSVVPAGGGVYCSNGSPVFTDCIFSSNTSAGAGAGMYNLGASPKLTDCIFTGNSAASAGGGLANAGGSAPLLINCVFSGNTTRTWGGAVYNDKSSPTFIACTLAGNTATVNGTGGALYTTATTPSYPATVTGCILWGNAAVLGSQLYGATTVTRSDIQGGGFVGESNINTDPLFVRNPSAGADGKWGTADDDYGDLRLQQNSPCIDAGSNAAVPADVTTDLVSNARIINYPGLLDPGAIVDMGAYERQLPIAVSPGADTAVTEGSGVTRSGSFTDTDITDSVFPATVNYGDGSGATPLPLNADRTFNLNHTYADNGLYTVTVTVASTNNGSSTGSFKVTVNNVAPTVLLPASVRMCLGSPGIATGSFADPGTLDTWTATIDYGDGSGTHPLSLNANNTFNVNHLFTAAGRYPVTVRVADKDGGVGIATMSVGVTGVTGRSIFYNNSFYDGNNAAANPSDDSAIATDKQALLPGQNAGFVNYTSFSKGINGLIIDVAALATYSLTPADFLFRAGTSTTPDSWTAAPAPSSITVRPGAGTNGSDRIEVIWSDNAIQKTWLQTTILATAATGLAKPDVFYFGSAIGETGNSATDAAVTTADVLAVRGHPAAGPVAITNTWDLNRDGSVNSADMLIAQANQAVGTAVLPLLAAPSIPLILAAPAASAATPIPVQPLKLLSMVQSNGSILLSWRDMSTNEDGFVIQASVNGQAWNTLATTPAGAGSTGLMSYTVSTLPPGSWQFRVLAHNAGGLSLPSNTRTVIW